MKSGKWRVASDEWRARGRTGHYPKRVSSHQLPAIRRQGASDRRPATSDQEARKKQIPRLRDPTRQKSARRKKSGRFARDDKGLGQEQWRVTSGEQESYQRSATSDQRSGGKGQATGGQQVTSGEQGEEPATTPRELAATSYQRSGGKRKATGGNSSSEWPFARIALGKRVASRSKETRDQRPEGKTKQVPRLRDPTRQTAARKRKSGRSARDDKGVGPERGKGGAAIGDVLVPFQLFGPNDGPSI